MVLSVSTPPYFSIPKSSNLLVRASHGKQPDGWMMPPNGSKSTAKAMTKLIVEKVDDIIWEIESHRRSDSNELPDFMEESIDWTASDQQDLEGRMLDLE